MNPDRQHAINYLRAPANGLWRWAEDGGVLVWRDGSTIAFRQEVIEIIKWLAPNGLPSFGAIVLLLAAWRRQGHRLLLWSGLCFAGFTVNNILLVLDKIVFPDVDLSVWRTSVALISIAVLLYGLIWDAD